MLTLLFSVWLFVHDVVHDPNILYPDRDLIVRLVWPPLSLEWPVGLFISVCWLGICVRLNLITLAKWDLSWDGQLRSSGRRGLFGYFSAFGLLGLFEPISRISSRDFLYRARQTPCRYRLRCSLASPTEIGVVPPMVYLSSVHLLTELAWAPPTWWIGLGAIPGAYTGFAFRELHTISLLLYSGWLGWAFIKNKR